MRLNKKTLTLVGAYLAFQIGSGVREENRKKKNAFLGSIFDGVFGDVIFVRICRRSVGNELKALNIMLYCSAFDCC